MGKQIDCDNQVLRQALEYHSRGWSIMPMGGDKKPPKGFRWKHLQKSTASKTQIKQWFGSGEYKSLAVICGTVSGGLCVLDLDTDERCQWWKDTHPELAEKLPTAKTRKGLHIYCRAVPFRKQNGDGLDLISEGGCALLPPSPDKEWTIPLNGELPTINPFDLGLEQFGIERPQQVLNFTEETKEAEDPEDTEDIERHRSHKVVVRELSSFGADTAEYIERAIESSIPYKMHTRNSGIFRFCRWLKGHDMLKDFRSAEIKPLIRLWWKRACDNIYTKSFTVTYRDFIHGWKRVKYPYGQGDEIVREAVKNALDIETIYPELENYSDEQDVVFFATVLKELQKLKGDDTIFIASRKAGGIVGCSHTEICSWYEMLEEDGVLLMIEEHTSTKAARYRYIAA